MKMKSDSIEIFDVIRLFKVTEKRRYFEWKANNLVIVIILLDIFFRL